VGDLLGFPDCVGATEGLLEGYLDTVGIMEGCRVGIMVGNSVGGPEKEGEELGGHETTNSSLSM